MRICRSLATVSCTVSIFLAGCERMPEPASADDLRRATCTFWHDDGNSNMHLMGGGVLVGFEEHGKRRAFCLTARHVAVSSRYRGIGGKLFANPGKTIIRIENESGSVPLRCTIAPVRWMTGGIEHDLAWFEFTEEEIREMERAGGRVIALGMDMAGTLLKSRNGWYLAGTAAIGRDAAMKVDMANGMDVLVFCGRWRYLDGSTGRGTLVTNIHAKVLKVIQPVEMTSENTGLCFPSSVTANQIMVEASLLNGDSGLSSFAWLRTGHREYPFAIGVNSLSKGARACVMPIDEMMKRIAGRNEIRLQDFPGVEPCHGR